MRAAQSVYAACLWLYPRQLREAHGDEMRQAFRDRCREAVRGERSAFRVLMLELFPDTLRSVGSAQVSETFDDMRPRQFWALGLLCCALIGLLFRDSLSRFTLDLAFQAKYALQRASDERDLSQHEGRLRDIGTGFLSVDSPENKALAAYAYRAVYFGRMTQLEVEQQDFDGLMIADGNRATALATQVLGAKGSVSAYALAIAVQACEVSAGCNRGEAIRQLIASDPGNGYGWALAFTWAGERHDEMAMQHAVKQLAQATRFDSYRGQIASDLLKQAQSVAPGDTDYLHSIASLVRSSGFETMGDYRNEVRVSCTPRRSTDTDPRPRWSEIHPEMQADCLRIAGLLSTSTDLGAARWGSWQVYEAELDPAARDRALHQLRDKWWWQEQASGVGINRHTKDFGWDAWTEDEWQNWANAWAPGDGEIPSVKRWLASRGLSVSAPQEFELPPWIGKS